MINTRLDFSNIVFDMETDAIGEGAVFYNNKGEKMIYKSGGLYWLVGQGFISSPVQINTEAIEGAWYYDANHYKEKISFTDALRFIEDGYTVTMELPVRGTYSVSSFLTLDWMVKEFALFSELYSADCYVDKVLEDEQETKDSGDDANGDNADGDGDDADGDNADDVKTEKAFIYELFPELYEGEDDADDEFDIYPSNIDPSKLPVVDIINMPLESLDEVYFDVNEEVPVNGKAPTGEEYKEAEQKLEHANAYMINVKHVVQGVTVSELAEEYGVSTRMIYYILDGTHWNDAYREFKEDFEEIRRFRKQ